MELKDKKIRQLKEENIDVFISYSSSDQDDADKIYGVLTGMGLRCWMASENMEPGEYWDDLILIAIKRCKTFLLVYSSHTDDSVHVPKEVKLALKYEKKIIPVNIDEAEVGRFYRDNLSRVHWIKSNANVLDDVNEAVCTVLGIRTVNTEAEIRKMREAEELKKAKSRNVRFLLVTFATQYAMMGIAAMFAMFWLGVDELLYIVFSVLAEVAITLPAIIPPLAVFTLFHKRFGSLLREISKVICVAYTLILGVTSIIAATEDPVLCIVLSVDAVMGAVGFVMMFFAKKPKEVEIVFVNEK